MARLLDSRRHLPQMGSDEGDHMGSPLRGFERLAYMPRSIFRTMGGMSFDITSGSAYADA